MESLVSGFPLLLPMNAEHTLYEGLIMLRGDSFRLQLSLPADGSISKASVHCCDGLLELLRDYTDVIEQRLRQSRTLHGFLEELHTLIDRLLKKRQSLGGSCSSVGSPRADFVALLADLDAVGWDRVTTINNRFDCIEIEASDHHGRKHQLQIRLSEKHPTEAPKCVADLPEDFSLQWPAKDGSIQYVVKQFEAALEMYQDFWDLCDQLDSSTWILEPEKPTRAASRRRIALRESVSVQVELRPKQPRSLPDIKLLGSDRAMVELRSKLHSRIHLWSEDRGLLENFRLILDVDFPAPQTSRKEDFALACGICYAYRLETSIPDQRCTNACCKQSFHQKCLYEWFRSVPTSRQSFNIVFGECPYCRSALTVKMPLK